MENRAREREREREKERSLALHKLPSKKKEKHYIGQDTREANPTADILDPPLSLKGSFLRALVGKTRHKKEEVGHFKEKRNRRCREIETFPRSARQRGCPLTANPRESGRRELGSRKPQQLRVSVGEGKGRRARTITLFQSVPGERATRNFPPLLPPSISLGSE